MKVKYLQWTARSQMLALLVLGTVSCIGCTTVHSGADAVRNTVNGLATSVKQISGRTPDQGLAKAALANADGLFEDGVRGEPAAKSEALKSAAQEYALAARRWPDSQIQEDALFREGESHFFADDYPAAMESYAELLKEFPNTRYLDVVSQRRFATAKYWLDLHGEMGSKRYVPNFTDARRPRLDVSGAALKELDRVRFEDPTGKLADDATMLAAVTNFQAGRYGEADMLFSDLRDAFPNSEHQFQAHLLGLKSKQMIYEGPDYDGAALEESQTLVRQITRVFPEQAVPHREVLETASKEIRLKLAQREYELAKFYDGKKEYRAARMQYDRVRREFADTNLALESESRLAQLGGLPDTPVQKLEWLVNAFPQDDDPKPLISSDSMDVIRR